MSTKTARERLEVVVTLKRERKDVSPPATVSRHKRRGNEYADMIDAVRRMPPTTDRSLSLAQTYLQDVLMELKSGSTNVSARIPSNLLKVVNGLLSVWKSSTSECSECWTLISGGVADLRLSTKHGMRVTWTDQAKCIGWWWKTVRRAIWEEIRKRDHRDAIVVYVVASVAFVLELSKRSFSVPCGIFVHDSVNDAEASTVVQALDHMKHLKPGLVITYFETSLEGPSSKTKGSDKKAMGLDDDGVIAPTVTEMVLTHSGFAGLTSQGGGRTFVECGSHGSLWNTPDGTHRLVDAANRAFEHKARQNLEAVTDLKLCFRKWKCARFVPFPP